MQINVGWIFKKCGTAPLNFNSIHQASQCMKTCIHFTKVRCLAEEQLFLRSLFVSSVDGIQRAAGQPAVVHRHRGRPLPSPSFFLPGPPGDWEDGYHRLPGEDYGWHQSPGDPSAPRKQHVRQVTASDPEVGSEL